MRKIIVILFFLFSTVQAQEQTSSSLFKVDSSWIVDPKTRLGSETRIAATQQNPFPYCFSTAAAMLYDQTNCNMAGKCDKPTSFLAITQAGQNLENTEELNPQEGGSPLKSITSLLTGRIIDHDKCNYDVMLTRSGLYRLIYDAKSYYDNYHKYKQRAAYLSNYYRYLLKELLETINPRSTLDLVDNILQKEKFDLNYVTFKTLLNPECFDKNVNANKYSVKLTKIDSKNIKPAILQIENLLRKKKPIIVSFCPTLTHSGKCADSLHSLVIIAQARIQHRITGDRRTAYWLVNSWGEDWQQKNSDGWVYADRLLESLVGELIWLE